MHGNVTSFNGQPCRHMVTLVSAYADDALNGLARWYTRIHIGGCPRCKAALDALTKLKDRLINLRSLPEHSSSLSLEPKRWERLEALWTAAEKKGPGRAAGN